MIYATSQFKQNDLQHLIGAVPRYPISIKGIISIASRKKLSVDTINFYRAFPEHTSFDNEKEIIERSELVSLLREEEVAQPTEDAVRGAED